MKLEAVFLLFQVIDLIFQLKQLILLLQELQPLKTSLLHQRFHLAKDGALRDDALLQHSPPTGQGDFLTSQGIQLGFELVLFSRNQSREGLLLICRLTGVETQQRLTLAHRLTITEQNLGHASAGRRLDLDGATNGFELALNGDHLVDPNRMPPSTAVVLRPIRMAARLWAQTGVCRNTSERLRAIQRLAASPAFSFNERTSTVAVVQPRSFQLTSRAWRPTLGDAICSSADLKPHNKTTSCGGSQSKKSYKRMKRFEL